MCRLQHSLGIVWRPQTPPLTAPTSNWSAQPCRRGPGAGGPSSHARRSGRCQSIAWSRGAHAGLYEGPRGAGDGDDGLRGTARDRGLEASPAPVFPGRAGARPTRRSAALLRPAAGSKAWGAGAAPPGTQPSAHAWRPLRRGRPSESKTQAARSKRSASAGPGSVGPAASAGRPVRW